MERSKRFSKKRIATIGLTFAVALGTGFLVQYGDALASRWGADVPVSGPSSAATAEEAEITPVTASVASPTVLAVPQSPVSPETNVIEVAAAADFVPEEEIAPSFAPAPVEPIVEDTPAVVEEQTAPAIFDEADTVVVADCSMELTAVEMKLAMVQLDLVAPCNANEVVTVLHDNLSFNTIADEAGMLSVTVPALSEAALFIVSFDSGESAIAETTVPDFASYDRAVLQWQGDMGVELHALEFGASYGEDGHLWGQSKGNFAAAMSGLGGVVTTLGDQSIPQPLMAEVYTFPSGISSQDGVVALSIEAGVTEMNCGRAVTAQTIQVRPNDDAYVTNLSMTMPSCDAIGEYVLLNNVLEDLTLASK